MELHDYQRRAVKHLHNNPRSALFLDMGLRYDRPMTICEGCGREFTPGPRAKSRPPARFCSRKCHFRTINTPEHQRAAGKIGGKVRGEQRHAERVTDWYLKQEGQHVHRTVAEACLGRPLEPGEIVHHEDRDKHNNHPSNLVVFPSQADHARHHKLNHFGPCECPSIRLGGDAR